MSAEDDAGREDRRHRTLTILDSSDGSNRNLRSLLKFVMQQSPMGDATPLPYAEHLQLLLAILQTTSSLLTLVFADNGPGGSTRFFTALRNAGLDAFNLAQDPPPDLLRQALDPANSTEHTFWHSPAMEEHYWPILLRSMFRKGQVRPPAKGAIPPVLGGASRGRRAPAAEGPPARVDVKASTAAVALVLRFYTVTPLMVTLLHVLDGVWDADPGVRTTVSLATLRLNLFAFLGKKQDRHPDEDGDPLNLVPRAYHAMLFGLAPGAGLAGGSTKKWRDVVGEVATDHGDKVAGIIAAASLSAGRTWVLDRLHQLPALQEEAEVPPDGATPGFDTVQWEPVAHEVGTVAAVTPVGRTLLERAGDVAHLNSLILRFFLTVTEHQLLAEARADPEFIDALGARHPMLGGADGDRMLDFFTEDASDVEDGATVPDDEEI